MVITMASHTREQRIIRSVPCPVCGAKVGEMCKQIQRTLDRNLKNQGRPLLHTERRLDWQEWKRRNNQ